MGHALVAPEIGTLHLTVGGDQSGEPVAIQLMLVLVPEQFFAGKAQTVDGADAHAATEFP